MNLFNRVKIVITNVIIYPIMGVLKIYTFFSKHNDKIIVSNFQTPVLLLHGNNSNKSQFVFVEKILRGCGGIGDVFSLNCSGKNIEEYSLSVIDYISEMRNVYKELNYTMDSLIIIGNSLGGIIGADVINKVHDVKFNLITISTPWQGSTLADGVLNDDFPNYLFKTISPARDKIRLQVLEKNVNVYSYGSECDFLVSSESSKIVDVDDDNRVKVDSRNGHLSTMVDLELISFIKMNWIIPNTTTLLQQV